MAHILVVEDEPLISTLIDEILSDGGHQVRVAGTLAEAWASLSDPVELALVDHRLPDGRSDRFVVELRSRRIPVVVISGAPQAGPVPVLAKPFSGDELEAVVRESVGTPAIAR